VVIFQLLPLQVLGYCIILLLVSLNSVFSSAVLVVVVAAAAALVTLPAPPPHGLATATLAAKINIICNVLSSVSVWQSAILHSSSMFPPVCLCLYLLFYSENVLDGHLL